jgi:phage terminase large subunit-like protein
LTPETSKGFACIEFAEAILEVHLLPWQKWLLIHALELNENGTYRFRTVVLLVARQNGKSTLMQVLSLWRMFVEGAPLVIGTAQNLDVAEEQWAGAVELVESIPELADMIAPGGVVKVNGKKALRLTTGERYKVAAASRRGGRGLSGDLVLLDELREHRNWEAWGAVTKTTMARALAQVWAASNAGDIASVVLRHLRTIAHRALGYPDGDEGMAVLTETPESEGADESLGLFEWSAKPGRTVWDRDGWSEANPSLGHTIDEKSISAAAATDPEWVFRTEVLCQFVNLAAVGPFPNGSWAATLEHQVERDTSRPACYGIDVSHNRQMAYVAVAFWDVQGRARVEIAVERAGTDWIIPWLLDPKRRIAPEFVTFQTKGAPVTSLADDFEAAGIDVAKWEGQDLAGWHGTFYDLLRKATADDRDESEPVPFTHGFWPSLDAAANSAAIRPIADGWVIDRRNSPHDAAPLMACIGAIGLLKTNPEPNVSVYETRELMFLD